METAADIFRKRDPEKIRLINETVAHDLAFRRVRAQKFWNDAPQGLANNPVAQRNLVIFCVYLSAYYSYHTWRQKLIEKPLIMAQLPGAYEVVTFDQPLAMDEATLKEQLLFFTDNEHAPIVESIIDELRDVVAGLLRDKYRTQYSKEGYEERGGQPDLTKYND